MTISGNVFQTTNTPRHDHSSVYTSGVYTRISNNTFAGATIYNCAIEVHGDHVAVTGNWVRGYYRAVNVVSSDTLVSANHVIGAGSSVDLWSTVWPGLRNVVVSRNVLNRNLSAWSRVLRQFGLPMASAQHTQQVSRDAASRLPFSRIVIRQDRG